MAENSRIGWTHHTMNFWWGCNKVSTECKNCYIAPMMRRGGYEPFAGPMRTKNWSGPQRWNRAAKRDGERRRVFTCSMSDFFHEGADEWRTEAWEVIRQNTELDWLILTKRPENILERLPSDWGDGWENVWLGVTAGVSDSLSRLDHLASIPAAVKFLSAEPLLESLNIEKWLPSLDWVIAGGESGGQRRQSSVAWYESLYEQCRKFGVAFYMKQDTHYRDGQQGRIDNELWSVKQFPARVAYTL